jgi:hypothetical protein
MINSLKNNSIINKLFFKLCIKIFKYTFAVTDFQKKDDKKIGAC